MNGLGEQVVERFKLSWRLQRQDFGAQAGKNKHHSFPARCGGVKKNKREELSGNEVAGLVLDLTRSLEKQFSCPVRDWQQSLNRN